MRPDIVLYEEMLDEDVLRSAVRFIRDADVLIVGGTSLGVYPAAGLINYYEGGQARAREPLGHALRQVREPCYPRENRRGVFAGMNRIDVLGVEFDDLTMDEAVERGAGPH